MRQDRRETADDMLIYVDNPSPTASMPKRFTVLLFPLS